MKDAVLTVRLSTTTRKRLERLARRQGRSLSGQVERLLDAALDGDAPMLDAGRSRRVRSVAGLLRGGLTPTLADFREARDTFSGSFARRAGDDAKPGR